MKPRFFRRLALPGAILVALIAGAVWMMKSRAPAPTAAPAAAATPATPATLVFLPQEVLTATPAELRQVLLLSGSLRALELATIKARVAGEVRDVSVREGEPVRAGQVVAKMDAAEYEGRLAQARGNLNAARAQLDIAAKARDNNAALVDKGFISKSAFDNSASQYAGARASVDAAQGALDIAQKQLNDTVLRSPIAGMVAVRNVQPGEKVSADYKLLEIINLQRMELEAAVPATDIGRVAIGQRVSLRVEGLADTFEGKVVRINPAAQAGTRSVPVYIQVANPRNQLRTGMFAEGQLVLSSKPGALALPQSAIRRDGSGTYVFTVDNGKIARVPVSLGIDGLIDHEFRTEIRAGLDFGTRVVRTDMGNLTPGTPVRVADPAAGAAPAAAATAAAPATATTASPAAR